MIGAECIEYDDCLEQETGWLDYYCLVSAESKIKVRRARGGEAIGHIGLGQVAIEGRWICTNPLNGHRWEMDDDSLHEFYAEEGKGRRVPPPKLQHGGKGRSESSSAKPIGNSWNTDETLFAGLAGDEGEEVDDEQQGQEEEGADGAELEAEDAVSVSEVV